VQVGGANRVVDARGQEEVEASRRDRVRRRTPHGQRRRSRGKIWQEEMGSESEGGEEDEEGESSTSSTGRRENSDESEPEPVDDSAEEAQEDGGGFRGVEITLGTVFWLDSSSSRPF